MPSDIAYFICPNCRELISIKTEKGERIGAAYFIDKYSNQCPYEVLMEISNDAKSNNLRCKKCNVLLDADLMIQTKMTIKTKG